MTSVGKSRRLKLFCKGLSLSEKQKNRIGFYLLNTVFYRTLYFASSAAANAVGFGVGSPILCKVL